MKAGDRLGQYVLEERLDGGGMGSVFRARLEGPQGFSRPVCIKIMHEHLKDDPELVAMFIKEARTGSMLRHQNVVRTFQFGEHGDAFYLVMDFVNGVNLDRVLKRLQSVGARMPIEAGLYIAHELLAGLAHAHAATDDAGNPMHVVHRDVCPDNVLVNFSNADVSLADFGIASVKDALAKTRTNVARGRLGYMPSEQFQNGRFDSRADLYAVGVTLYEMFVGWHPFGRHYDDSTEQSIVTAQALNLRNPLAPLRSDLAHSVVDLIERLLSPLAKDRPQSADEALEALGSVSGGAKGKQTLAALMSQLYPGQASTAAIPLRANALVLPPAIPRPPLPKPPSNDRVDPYASTALRPSAPPRSDEETAPPFTTDMRIAAPRSSASGTRIPAWTIALTAAVLMAGTALTVMRTRGRGHAQTAPPIAAADPSARPVTRLNLAAPPAIAEVPAPPAVAPEAPTTPDPTPTLPTHATSTRTNIATPHPAPPPTVAAATEAPHPAIRSGTLRVVALPWGEVFVDGTARGRAPVSVTVTAGEHLVRITGGVEHTERVVVIAGATRVVAVDGE